MKKYILVILAMMGMLFAYGCNDDNLANEDEILIGKDDAMVLMSERISIKALGGDSTGYYVGEVPAEGVSLNLEVKNYPEWRISSIGIRSSKGVLSFKDDDYTTLYSKFAANQGKNKAYGEQYDGWYKINMNGNSMDIAIPQNTTSDKRTIRLVMTTGDVYAQIYLEQAAHMALGQ